MIPSHVRPDIDRLIAGDLSVEQHRKVRTHIRDCGDCAQYYEEQRALEDALFASTDLAPSAIERMQELVLADLEPRIPSPWKWSAIVGFAAVAAALVLWVQRPSEFTARGGESAVLSGVGLSLFAIDPATKSVRHVSDDAHLTRGTVVELAYSNTDFDYGAVIAVDADGEFTWFYDARISHDVRQEPFHGAWTLGDAATTVRIFAIFARTPIDTTQVEQEIRALAKRDLHASTQLGTFATQDSIEVHID